MSDGVLIALASIFVAGITVGAPLTITAYNTRKIVRQADNHAQQAALAAQAAADVARSTQTAIGTPNGDGDLMQMAARALGENSEIFKQLLELYNYTHFNIHEIYNAMTAKFGQIDILWDRAGLPPMPAVSAPSKFTPMPKGIWALRENKHDTEDERDT